MTQKRKKKPLPEASPPVPAPPDPPHVQAAIARFREYAATMPPGLSISQGENGLVIDTDPPGLKHGMTLLMDTMGSHDLQFFTG